MKILHIDSSPKFEQSNSKSLSQFFIQQLLQNHANIEIDYLDLSCHPLPHIDGLFAKAIYTHELERNEAMILQLKDSDRLCKRVLQADCAVFGIPMHNWCYPSVFKAFIDHITRIGITYQYDDEGKVSGNLHAKKMIFITTRGADLSCDPTLASMDALTPAIKSAFGFLGVKDMTFVNVQPLQFSNYENHQMALNTAKRTLSSIATSWL